MLVDLESNMTGNNAVKSPEFRGFYEIPGFSKYVVSRKGEVINKRTGEKLRGNVKTEGYIQFRLTGDNGHVLSIGRHRILGIVFKHPGCSIDKLVVNHIDSIPGHDDLDNLEWTTHRGNLEHAGRVGRTSKCIPISVRDVLTGEVVDYPSAQAYARTVGWSKDKVIWRVKIGETKVFPEMKQYRRSSIKTPWYIPKNPNREAMFNFRSRKTLVRYVLTDNVLEFDTLTEAARHLKICKAAASNWINAENQPLLPGFIQMKYKHDETPWRTISDPYLEHELFSGQRTIKVKEISTGKELLFQNATVCSRAMHLNLNALYYRLKSKGETVYSDGYTYAYYSDVCFD